MDQQYALKDLATHKVVAGPFHSVKGAQNAKDLLTSIKPPDTFQQLEIYYWDTEIKQTTLIVPPTLERW